MFSLPLLIHALCLLGLIITFVVGGSKLDVFRAPSSHDCMEFLNNVTCQSQLKSSRPLDNFFFFSFLDNFNL